MSNKHCRQLSNGYKINIDNRNSNLLWSPCCFYAKKINLADSVKIRKEIEYTSNVAGWLPECGICKQMEETSIDGFSPRLNSFIRIPEEFDDGDCVDLEISFDTSCNAACMSCSSACSSTWDEFNKKHNGASVSHYYGKTENANFFLQSFIKRVPLNKLRTVFITGGEPLYTNTHVKLLEHIYAVHPNPELITLRYITNGSIFPEAPVLELWTKFKEVQLILSLDGVETRFEYLRWPLNWNNVTNVIDKFITETNARITINQTISPLNLLYWHELENWVDNNIPKDRLTSMGVRPNRCFGDMDLHFTSLSMRDEFYKQYGVNHKVSKILLGLEVNNNSAKMISYLDQIDPLRNQSWRETFPDAVKFYVK